MARNYIIENDPNWDGVPVELKSILSNRFEFQSDREFIYDFSKRMKENPDRMWQTIFNKIESGSNIIFQTNFHEEIQIEEFIMFMSRFMVMDIRINFYIYFSKERFESLEDGIRDYLTKDEAYYTIPKYKGREKEWKLKLNEYLTMAIDYHNIYRMRSYDSCEDEQITSETLELRLPALPL